MDVMDFCRFCHVNMRIKGTLGGTIKIFDNKKHSNEKSVYERLIALGVTLFRSPLISHRMCKLCFRQLGRMEDHISILWRWEKEDKDKEETERDTANATSTVATVEVPAVAVSGRLSPDDRESACSSRSDKRDREPTPSKTPRKIKKHRPKPVTPVHSDTPSPTPTAPRRLFKPTTAMPARQSLLEVTIRGKTMVCDNNTAGIVEHITRENWTTAANLIVRHDELFGEVKENVLKVIEDESKTLCNPYKNFMLWRSSPDDLKVFSLANLMSDLQRMSPFLFAIFHRISKQSPNVTCAAAAIALRGREPRLSAFAYYVNNVLLYGGAKKAVFKRLSKLGITTSHGHAVAKQKELAKTCGEEFHLLKVANELFLDSDSDGNTTDAARGGTPLSDTASSRDLVSAIRSLQMSVLSDESSLENTIDTQGAEGGCPLGAEGGVSRGAEGGFACGAEGGFARGAEGGETGFSFSLLADADMADLGVSLLDLGSPLPSQQTPPSKYSIIFDNLDFFIRPHHQSISEANKSIHWVHHMAVEDRVPTAHLSSKNPTQPLEDYNIGHSLPGLESQHFMRCEFIALGGRILTEYLDAFKPLSSVVVTHIPHKYSATMTEASTHHPLGLLFKDENKTDELVEVLQHFQKEYVPTDPHGQESVLVGGDRLSEGNSRNIKLMFADGETREEKLEGLVFKFEDWHAIRNLFEIYHKVFFTEESSRDHGTLFSNMNKLRCSNAKKGPHAAFNAYKDFVQKDTAALFLAATMEHFGLKDVTDVPENFIPSHIRKGSTDEEKRDWLHAAVSEIVDQFVLFAELSDVVTGIMESASDRPPQGQILHCRMPGCPKTYKYSKARENHEKKLHGLTATPPMGAPDPVRPIISVDHKQQHTEARLGFGFLLANFQDAVKEGDGERLLRLYTVALMFYKNYGHNQYAYSTLLLTVQVNATFSPRLAHSVTWNRFWNGRGGKGKNISLDLHMEHLNNFLKSYLKRTGPNMTERAADRISKSIGVLKDMMDITDTELNVSKSSGIHHARNRTTDILALVEVVMEAELFKHIPGRQYTAFPNFDKNLLSKVKYAEMWGWIRSRLQEWQGITI